MSEILEVIISLGGILLSGIISWLIAKSTANKEIEKMKLTWQHDDNASSADEFADMVASVTDFITSNSYPRYRKACAKVNAIRSKENGELALALDSLYGSLTHSNDSLSISNALDKAISIKRNCSAE